MQKTITLYPAYITEGSAFGGILSENGTGEDYRTIGAGSSVNAGVIAFKNAVLRSLSSACVLTGYRADYRQKCNYDTWADKELVWTLTPAKLTKFSVNGSTLSVAGQSKPFGRNVVSKTSGRNYLDKGGAFIDSGNAGTVDGTDLFGNPAVTLGFALQGKNEASLEYQLYMKSLFATVTYTARYIATFYDSDGRVIERQTVNGGEAPSAPVILREGYVLSGWEKNGTTYAALPTGIDTDVQFTAVWTPIFYQVTVPRIELRDGFTAYCLVEQYVNGNYRTITLTTDGDTDVCRVVYGTPLRITAIGFHDRTQDLIVSVNAARHTLNGEQSEYLPENGIRRARDIVFETDGLTNDTTISLEAVDVYYNVTVDCNYGGVVSESRLVLRGSSFVCIPQPYEGYEIADIAVDGVSHGNLQQMTVTPTADIKIEVTFDRIVMQVILDLLDGVIVDGPEKVLYGDSAVWTFSAPDGYSLNTIDLDGTTLLDAFRQTKTFTIAEDNITTVPHFFATATNDLITAEIAQSENGRVYGDTGTYIRGKGSLTFAATANSGFVFSGWFNETTDNPLTIAATENLVISALFDAAEYQVRREITGQGTIEVSSEWVKTGDKLFVRFLPAEGWRFDRALIIYMSYGPSIHQVTFDESDGIETVVEGSPEVVATFKIQTFPCSFTTDQIENTVEVLPAPNDDGTYDYGTILTLKAIPAEGWYFERWSDDAENFTLAERKIAVKRAVNLKAVFRKYTYAITVKTAAGGIATESGTVEHGDDFHLTVTAGFGQRVGDVLLDDVSIYGDLTLTQRGATYLLPAVTESHDFTVTFAAKTYTNVRRLTDYWPPVIQCISEMQEIARIQQPLIDEAWDAVSFVMENQFIDSATSEGVELWEKELGIIPSAFDTLAQRKARLRLRWVPDNRFTMRWLYNWLKAVCDSGDIRKPTVKDYTLRVPLPSTAPWMAIFGELEAYKPAHLLLLPVVELQAGRQEFFIGTAMKLEYKVKIPGNKPEGV